LPDDEQVLANDYIVDYDHPEMGKTKLVGVPVILSKTPGNARGRAPSSAKIPRLFSPSCSATAGTKSASCAKTK